MPCLFNRALVPSEPHRHFKLPIVIDPCCKSVVRCFRRRSQVGLVDSIFSSKNFKETLSSSIWTIASPHSCRCCSSQNVSPIRSQSSKLDSTQTRSMRFSKFWECISASVADFRKRLAILISVKSLSFAADTPKMSHLTLCSNVT